MKNYFKGEAKGKISNGDNKRGTFAFVQVYQNSPKKKSSLLTWSMATL